MDSEEPLILGGSDNEKIFSVYSFDVFGYLLITTSGFCGYKC